MNIVEGLARELVRVGKLSTHYEMIGPSGLPALRLTIEPALEKGCLAAGLGEPIDILAALEELKGITG